MRRRMMRYGLAAMTLVAILASATSARSFGLTEDDYGYLAARDVERASAVLRGLSPREQARLQAVINDAATAGDEAARATP